MDLRRVLVTQGVLDLVFDWCLDLTKGTFPVKIIHKIVKT